MSNGRPDAAAPEQTTAVRRSLPQLKHFDGLRVVFCVAIHGYHLKNWDFSFLAVLINPDEGKDKPGRFEHVLDHSSTLGVSYFFVLAGYLAFYTAATKPTASWGERKEYMWKKFARLMPTLWASGIIYVVLTELFENAKAKPLCIGVERPLEGRGCALSTAGAGSFAWAVFLYAFALQDITPIPQGIWVNEPAWFVSAICFCYIAYICTHKYLVRWPWSTRTLSCLLGFVILLRSLPTLVYYLPCQLSSDKVSKLNTYEIIQPRPPFILETYFFWNMALYRSPVIRFFEFLIGALVAKLGLQEDVETLLSANRKVTEIGSDVAFAIGALWMLYVQTDLGCQSTGHGFGDLFGHCLPLALWMLVSTHSTPEADDCKHYGLINKLLACKALVTLSPWTYSAYMYQLNVKVLTAKTGLLYEGALDAQFSILLFMWVVGGIMHIVVEKPGADWLLKHGPSAPRQRTALPLHNSSSHQCIEATLKSELDEGEPLVQPYGPDKASSVL
eukprot:7533568-Pyramimonas_sp.AAC.2